MQPQINGAERNRTAVREAGLNHLVHSKMDISILTDLPISSSKKIFLNDYVLLLTINK
ncbi:hypothetical protein [Prochlorococcus sp. MIT 0603]|uniref:hypothetical protein n=1 Tax=unclassified Prochlorococcus TaxID=2627481 RepID=UPI0039A76211